jgi:Phospholipase_D-nuclease N-terminal/Short C-terminal domain
MLAADFALGEALWAMFVFFMWIIWFWLLIVIFGDLFRDHETSGVAKAGWMILIIVLPYLGILIYLIARGGGMAERNMARAAAAQSDFDSYVRQTAGGGSAAEIAHAKKLLDDGAISQAEFDQLKAKALA